jgi:hypothetical protein
LDGLQQELFRNRRFSRKELCLFDLQWLRIVFGEAGMAETQPFQRLLQKVEFQSIEWEDQKKSESFFEKSIGRAELVLGAPTFAAVSFGIGRRYTENVDALAAEMGRKAGKKPWGMYEFALSDPD